MKPTITKECVQRIEWDHDVIMVHDKDREWFFTVEEVIEYMGKSVNRGRIHEYRPYDCGKYGIELESTGSESWQEWWDREGSDEKIIEYLIKNQKHIDYHGKL